ncbi:MAG: protein tyrosine phosphatase family protein [Deltaproteobacteria bacterium]|nr:protein tyrosine phosphatase family protein [Deltaproteobacteria bacterium]
MDQILNFVQLTDSIGTAGQPTAEQFRDIAAAGYSVVVNLAVPDSHNAVANEGSLVTATGMTYVNIPVKWEDPTLADLQRFLRTMRAFEGEKIFVHCAMNMRVSAFMFHYLTLEQGLPPERARSPILEKWAPKMDAVWQRFLALTPEAVRGKR